MATRGESKITETTLRRIRLDDGGTLLQDGGGLRALVTENRRGRIARFSYRFRLNGARVDIRLGTWPDKTLAEIRRERDAARVLVRAGTDPRAAAQAEAAERDREKAQAAARLTVTGLFENWERLHLAGALKDGGREVKRALAKDLLPAFGDLPAAELTRAHVARAVDQAIARGAPRAAQMLLVYTRQLCRWGVERGYLNADPTAAVRKAAIPVNRPRERVLSDDEIRALIRALPAAGLPPWAPPAALVLLATAARVGELLRARVEDLDLERAEWRIPAEHAKNGRAHLVHLSGFALGRFRELLALSDGTWLICGRTRGSAPDEKALSRLVRDRQRVEGRTLAKRTERHPVALVLPGGPWTPHDLRRTAATVMQARGVLPAVIEACLNHAGARGVIRVYQRYGYEPERRDAFERLGAHLEHLARGEAGRVVAFARSA